MLIQKVYSEEAAMPNPRPKPEPPTPVTPADDPEQGPADPPPPHEPGPDQQIQDPPVFPERNKRGKILVDADPIAK